MKEILGAPIVQVIDPVAAATNALTGSVDTKAARHATFLIKRGLSPSTSGSALTISLSQSDDTNSSNFATYAQGAYTSMAVNTAAAVLARVELDLKGRKRYQKLTLTPGTHTTYDPVILSADCILSRREQTPIAYSSLASGQVAIITGQGAATA